MRFLKNRTVLGVLCIVLSLIICFAVTPLFNKAMSEKTEIVRVVKPISVGEEITSDMVKTIDVVYLRILGVGLIDFISHAYTGCGHAGFRFDVDDAHDAFIGDDFPY